MANTSSGQPGALSYLVDQSSGLEYLVDTGSVYSFIPFKSKEKQPGPRLCTADRQPLACWGYETRTLRVGGRNFPWRFLRAAVAFPILGADFLAQNKIWWTAATGSWWQVP